MRDILSRYGFEYKHRMKCPLHNGDDLNFAVSEKTFMCFSHCGGGDVITFVQRLFGLTFPDALKRIDADFGLNLYGNQSFDDFRKSYYDQKQSQEKQKRENAERQRRDTEYWAVFDEWKRLDDNKRKFAPKTENEEFHPLYVEALQKIAFQAFLLDCIDRRKTQ